MKRSPIALLPWMALVATAYGQTRSADVIYTHHDDVPTRAFRVGDECFVSLEDVARWGWTTNTYADTVDVKAEGRKFAVTFRTINGQQVLPLRAALKKLGGDCEWVGSTDTLQVFTKLSKVSVRDGKVLLSSGLEFKPRATTLSDPSRVVVDMVGARFDGKTLIDLDQSARVVQYKPNVARLIIETPNVANLDQLNSGPTREIEFTLTKPVEMKKPPVGDEEGGEGGSAVAPAPTPGVAQQNGMLDVRVEAENRNEARLKIPVVTATPATFRRPDMTTLEIVLPGVSLDLPMDFRVASDSVASAITRREGNDTVLTLTLSRAMGVQVTPGTDGVSVSLQKPNVGDGKLAGKVIVVDPGHGGHDKGANSGGVYEKNLNLIMGKLIAAELSKQGATVIMTRTTDVFIPLNTRAKIANENHADLFISSHINSTGGSGSQTGGITFHHLGKGTSRVLAECIQSEIAKVSGLPNLGAWSDGRIYRTGFAVLRQTNMPGVLLELGFINHPRDRKRLVQEDFQRSVAAAVVRGVKVFLGDAKKND